MPLAVRRSRNLGVAGVAEPEAETHGYCVSGATPAGFPTLVLGVPGAASHQIAMDEGVFAECDNKVTVTAFSPTKPS
ncbi:hypothetical protein [Streptomyces sp. NPDC097981]|uniref:hypothetical protein n=1 Tax=Streptomyces sp. NPDC097981 TaxID=3155428 RepID=UPI0033236E17